MEQNDLFNFCQNHTVIRRNDFHSRITIKLKISANRLHFPNTTAQFRLRLLQGPGRPKTKASFSEGFMSLAFVKLFRIDSHRCSPFQRFSLSEPGVEHEGPNYKKQQISTRKRRKRKGKKTVPLYEGVIT